MGVDLTLCIDGPEVFRRQSGLDDLCVLFIIYYHLGHRRGGDLRLCIDGPEVFRRQPGLENLCVFSVKYTI